MGPSSVLGNWRSELQTWGAFRVAVYHGPKRDLALDGVLQGRTEVLITSYGTYRWGPLCINHWATDIGKLQGRTEVLITSYHHIPLGAPRIIE